ncbi:hypothetical protein BMS3Abin03_01984 [bacterium BMS3Abin03]|nr:hypothetical protein BMS3Abin03_01984 [bacterium BMS3Abin03]
MIVPYKNYIETRNLFSYKLACIFVSVCFGRFAIVRVVNAGVEQPDEQIGIFSFFNYRHPLFCRNNHVLKFNTFPYLFWKPFGNSGSYHSEHGNFNTAFLYNGVRFEIRLACFCINCISRKPGKHNFCSKLIVNSMTCFNIVITDCCSIIFHNVHCRCTNMGCCCIFIIIIIN